MQLHWAWAVIAALALGTGLAWWTQPARKAPDGDVVLGRHDAVHPQHAHATSEPRLYRWIDANGVVNITTDHPPPGRHFSIVHIDPNQNIVPMSHGDNAAKVATKPH